MHYTLNLGLADRFIRTLIAIVIASVGFYFESWLGLLALVLAATSLIGWCPIYKMLNFTDFSEPHNPRFNSY